MEENNRKGPGIFYAVVGVATLVVAIIGATFAFFSAQAQDSSISGTTASAGGINLAVTKVTETSSNLIPLNLRVGDTAGKDTVDQFANAMAGKCIDSNNNNVCQIYKIVVSNKSTTSTIQIRGTLTLKSAATNMYWRLINVTEGTGGGMTAGAKVDYSTDVQATASGASGNITVGGNSGGTGASVASKTLGFSSSDNSATYYVVVWLEEMGAAQENADAAKSYSGVVAFEAVDAQGNASGITASFTGA